MTIEKKIYAHGGSLEMAFNDDMVAAFGGISDGDGVLFCKVGTSIVMRKCHGDCKPKHGEAVRKVRKNNCNSLGLTLPASIYKSLGMTAGVYTMDIKAGEITIIGGSRKEKEAERGGGEYTFMRIPNGLLAAIGCTGGDDVDIVPVPGGIMIRKRDSGAKNGEWEAE